MAKKSGFNMSAEFRAMLAENSSLTSGEAFRALEEKFPKQKLNKNSAGVAFFNTRKKLGLTPKRKGTTVRKQVPSVTAAKASSLDFEALKSAKAFLEACGGDKDVALQALKQLGSLQISG